MSSHCRLHPYTRQHISDKQQACAKLQIAELIFVPYPTRTHPCTKPLETCSQLAQARHAALNHTCLKRRSCCEVLSSQHKCPGTSHIRTHNWFVPLRLHLLMNKSLYQHQALFRPPHSTLGCTMHMRCTQTAPCPRKTDIAASTPCLKQLHKLSLPNRKINSPMQQQKVLLQSNQWQQPHDFFLQLLLNLFNSHKLLQLQLRNSNSHCIAISSRACAHTTHTSMC